MPNFSETSMKRLKACDLRLQLIMMDVIKLFDFSVTEGHRTKEKQNEYYENNRSKLQWPNSKHNSFPSKAIDIAPYPIDYDNIRRFYYLAGFVMKTAQEHNLKLRWGGDWDMDTEIIDNGFNDLVHFEIID